MSEAFGTFNTYDEYFTELLNVYDILRKNRLNKGAGGTLGSDHEK